MLFEQIYKTEQQRLVESYVYADPVFEQWRGLGSMISERKMTEPEILDLFGKIETGMTNKDTGANRTMLGRGKDKTTKVFTTAKDAFNSVMSSIQNSAPVQAVDVAYDQATDAVANLTGGQQTKVMQAIKGYRNLVKEYPKTSGFAKAALVAIAGLATGGAGLPAIAGLTYALDSAIRGDKLSSVIGKGAGASAVTWAGQSAADALRGAPADSTDSSVAASDSLGPGEKIASIDDRFKMDKFPSGDVTDYVVKKGDTLSDIAKANNVSVDDLMKANAGQTIVKPNGQSITWNDANALSDVNAMGDYVGPNTGVQQDYSVSTSPKIANPDVLATGQTIKIPAPTGSTPYAGDVGLAGDTWNKIGTGAYPYSNISANQAAKYNIKENVKFKILPVDKLFDDKLTVMTWALNESVGKPAGHSVHLTTLGVYTVFENVNRYARAVVKEAVGPGRPDLPDEFRPDMPGGSGGYDKSKKGIVGKGLDWLDRATGKVGGALSKFGHQFTTKVTKEKLKMDWHQAGKPSDSDAIAAFLSKQGVPQNVIGDVYGGMGIPAPTNVPAPAPVQSQTNKGGAQTSLPYYGINPATKKPWTVDELQAKSAATTTANTTATTAGGATGKSFALPQATSSTAGQPSKVTYGKGFEKKPATTQFPSFGTAGTAGGYATSTPGAAPVATKLPKPTTAKISPDMPAAPANPVKTNKDELTKQVEKMSESIRTKRDADVVRKYIDQQFAIIGLTENTLLQRKKLMDHVTKVSAIQRRLHATQTTK